VYGLLTAITVILLINSTFGQTNTELEGFDGGGTVSEKKIVGRKWFVEQVLGETPKKIATDKVNTTAVET
jgi:hypothetical protein